MSITRRTAILSISASIITLILKFGAYFLTGSAGLFSDACESLVNLTAGLVAFAALTVAARPADPSHTYGHDKAEYFSSGVEGSLILVAAATIIYAAVQKLLHPTGLAELGPGLLIALLASGVNFAVSRIMLGVARRYDSITLEADAQHLMTDVWTSVGVVVGLGVVMIAPPSWQVLDPIIAIAVALNIIRTGIGLIRRSVDGLMDYTLPADELAAIHESIAAKAGPDAVYHKLRTRKSGSRRFVELHLLLPGDMSVQAGHALASEVECEIRDRLTNTVVTIHIEPRSEARPTAA